MRKFIHRMDSKMADYHIYADCSDLMAELSYCVNELKTFEQFKKEVEKLNKEKLIASKSPTESKIIHWSSGYICRKAADGTIRRSYNNLSRKNTCPEPIKWEKPDENCPEKKDLSDSQYKYAVTEIHRLISESE